MASSTIQEFLVKLGFKVDPDSFAKFNSSIAAASKETVGLGLKATAAATAVAGAITKISEQYEDLYYASIRAGSGAGALRAFEFGSKAIGQTAASVEELNIQLLANPGKVALLNMLGIQTAGRATTAVFNDLIDTLAKMPRVLAFQYGAQFGLSPQEINQRIILRKQQIEAERIYAEKVAASGINLDVLSEKSRVFDQEMRNIWASIGLVADQTADKWLPGMTQAAKWLDTIAMGAVNLGRETDGLSSSVLSLIAALGGLKAFSWLLAFLPGSAAAAAAGGLGLVAGIGTAAALAAGTGAALLMPTNKSNEADIYKHNPATGQMELTEYGRSLNLGQGPSGPPGGAQGGQPAAGDVRARTMSYFMSQGWSREAAAGIAANIAKESNFNPRSVGDAGQAFGLAQWHPDRQRAFRDFAGKDIRDSTFEEQLAFIHHELTAGKEQAAGARLRGASSAAGAGAIVSQLYERPANAQGEAFARAQLAKQMFDASLAPSPGTTAGSGGPQMNQTNNVTISGVSDPNRAVELAGRELRTSGDNLVRNAGTNIR